MPKKDSDQPLAEAFVQLMQPSAELIEVAREKAARRNTDDWQTCLLERAVTAARDIACGRAPPPCGDEAAALLHEFRRRVAEGGGRVRGHEGSLIGPQRDLSRIWPHAQIDGDGTVMVPGEPSIRFYGVVVAAKPVNKRGRRLMNDEDAVREMRRRLLADPALSVRRVAQQLVVDEKLVDLRGAEPESVVRRLTRKYRCTKFDD